LSRFATIWGINEADKPDAKVMQCFKEESINYYLNVKEKNKIHPIQNAPLLSNGHSLVKENVVSKSKVLGF